MCTQDIPHTVYTFMRLACMHARPDPCTLTLNRRNY